MRTFRDLKVWTRAHALTLEVYARTNGFPPEEEFSLKSQLRRAAISIEANLAEGCKRSTRKDFARHVAIAEGSASEVDCLLLLARDLGYIDRIAAAKLASELDQILRILGALKLSLLKGPKSGTQTSGLRPQT
jgi:four helix bundle protein